jgi:hypothetical protein
MTGTGMNCAAGCDGNPQARSRPGPRSPAAWAACRGPCGGMPQPGSYAVTACFWSLLLTWMLRGLAASWTGMVRVSTPAA